MQERDHRSPWSDPAYAPQPPPADPAAGGTASPRRRPFMIAAVLAAVVPLGAAVGVAVAVTGDTKKDRDSRDTRAADPGTPVPSISIPSATAPSLPAQLGGVEPDPRMTTPSGPEFKQIENACALFPKPALARLVPAATGRPGRGTEEWTCAWKSSQNAGADRKTRVTRELTATITIKQAAGRRSATYTAARQTAQERWWAQNPDKSPVSAWQSGGRVHYQELPGLGDEAFVTYAVQKVVGETGVGTVHVRVRNAVIEVTFKGGTNRLDRFGDEVFAGQKAMPENEARAGARELAAAAVTAMTGISSPPEP
ncbi:hypothetical protein ACGFNU_50305 [Spirillospora sp. NPDC048911]|uniref:hypothetical protein n=1 Tax=Spirillospora sp. NPDC048911 TaxID=3364527 RepID=UPI00371034DA